MSYLTSVCRRFHGEFANPSARCGLDIQHDSPPPRSIFVAKIEGGLDSPRPFEACPAFRFSFFLLCSFSPTIRIDCPDLPILTNELKTTSKDGDRSALHVTLSLFLTFFLFLSFIQNVGRTRIEWRSTVRYPRQQALLLAFPFPSATKTPVRQSER